jgi:hypothetical protein
LEVGDLRIAAGQFRWPDKGQRRDIEPWSQAEKFIKTADIQRRAELRCSPCSGKG